MYVFLPVLICRMYGAVTCVAFGPHKQEQVFTGCTLVDLIDELA
jgi:hypothetical protein